MTSVEQARALLVQAKGTVALLVQHEGTKGFVTIALKTGG